MEEVLGADGKFYRKDTRNYNVGASDYAQKTIQPWDIWLEYSLNPWDADIIKRVLRNKPNERRLDYEKIIHVCRERIRQIDEGLDNACGKQKESTTVTIATTDAGTVGYTES